MINDSAQAANINVSLRGLAEKPLEEFKVNLPKPLYLINSLVKMDVKPGTTVEYLAITPPIGTC